MPTFLKDLIHIPEKIHSGDFVLSLAEGVEKPEQTLSDYVVTPQLQHCFRDALEFVKAALVSNASKITYLHGSFGSGKSHFMAVLDLILSNHKAARAKIDLQDICAENSWTEDYKLLMVPYHMIGAESMEQAILGGYARFIKKRHPDAEPPSVYLSEGLFNDAADMRTEMGDEKFFQMLNGGSNTPAASGFGSYGQGWNAATYEAAVESAPGDDAWERVVTALTTRIFKSYSYVTSGAAEAYLPLDQGLAVLSRHAKSLGYHGIILFLDELVLWLASRAAVPAFVHQEGQKLAKLMEAQEAERPIPIVSFVARQRTLQELVGENVTGMEKAHYDDALRHWSGRFHTIELEDINLPDIVEGRVLKPKDASAIEQIDEAFRKISSNRDDVMAVLMTSQGNRDMFRKVYPFSPALVETLVAASSLLQRNRTAIRALMELLVEQRDELTLGNVIPVGDLFDIVSKGNDVFSAGMRQHFDNAKRLYQDRFRPMLEAEHHIREDEVRELKGTEDQETLKKAQRFRNDARLVKTLLLSALVPRVESLQNLTPQRLAALNHGTIKTVLEGQEASQVLQKLRRWNTQIGELRVSEGDNPTITLQLVGVDVERILEYSGHVDIVGNRKKKIKELLAEAIGIHTEDLLSTHTVLWRGTEYSFPVEFANVREKTTDALNYAGSDWKLLIDYPFDVDEFNPKDDLGRIQSFRQEGGSSKTLVWLPQFMTNKVQRDLGRLVMFDHVLTGDNFTEATRHLSPQDIPQARTILENQRSALRSGLMRNLEMVYGLGKPERSVVNFAVQLELNEQFQSLWAGFTPRPPSAPSLKGAMDELLTQALAHEYPGHPDFQVESRITRSLVRSVWSELARLPEAGGDRLEVSKPMRGRVRSIAQPLQLGTMAETHFVPSEHWGVHFDKKLSLEGIKEPSVADFDRWIDDPKPTGLPQELRDLVILFFAIRTNRSFKIHGAGFQPEIGSLKRETILVVQPLPSQEDWDQVRTLAKKVFDIPTTPRVTADAVSRFAEAMQEKASSYEKSGNALPGALSEMMKSLGQDPESSDRLRAAREAKELLKTCLSEGKPKELIEALAGLKLSCTPQEIAASVRSARDNVNALNDTRIFGLLKQTSAEEILDQLHRTLEEHEFVTALSPSLDQLAARAFALVSNKLGSDSQESATDTGSTTSATVGAPTATVSKRTVVSEKSLKRLSPQEARAELKKIEEALAEGRFLDISWQVWED